MRQIIFWRHGRTVWNAEQRFQGQTDIELDELGQEQAKRAAAMLATLKPTNIISSDLKRARDTANELAKIVNLEPMIDERLRETYAGAWQGMTRTELEAQFADELEKWAAAVDIRPGGNGETRLEVAVRTQAAIEDALREVPSDGILVVASHGGATRVAICSMLGLPVEHWTTIGVLGNCAWAVLQETKGNYGSTWRLHEFNAGTLPEPTFADDR